MFKNYCTNECYTKTPYYIVTIYINGFVSGILGLLIFFFFLKSPILNILLQRYSEAPFITRVYGPLLSLLLLNIIFSMLIATIFQRLAFDKLAKKHYNKYSRKQ
ncbi:hypothetical protein [Vallitalea guaymasensis]|uniref:hypothetical protein n=1 Tax=Vallitalea guaymasensis TaxID=1185412 RepID=UPI000DE1EDC5|nr:hypothetical protein [Vallitalea guaymasensis]